MIIHCLVDNRTTNSSIGTEHGLSLFIITDKRTILFDTGASGLFITNAHKLGINLDAVDTAILSHGHYDHGGGIKEFFRVNKHAKIYIQKEAGGDFYSQRADGMRYIGLDKELIDNPRIIATEGRTELGDGLSLFSVAKRRQPLFSTNSNLKMQVEDTVVQDEFRHEQSLIIKEGTKRVLIAGCAHNGITNIIDEYIRIEGVAPDVVVGGLHLCNPSGGYCESDAVIDALAKKLAAYGSKFYTGHCTGEQPYQRLKSKLYDSIDYLFAGENIEIQKLGDYNYDNSGCQ